MVDWDNYFQSEPQTFKCWGYFFPKHKDAKIFEKHLNPIMLVFLDSYRRVLLDEFPGCLGFIHFSSFFASFSIFQISNQQHNG